MSLSDHLILKFLWAFGLLALLASPFSCRSHPRVVISTKSGGQLALQVEVADTPAKRSLGLQYRNELGEDQGMLFLFPSEGAQSFWMKNTPLPLDMIFIGSNLKIVGIIHQAVPFSTTLLTVPAPSRFVLEIKGGLSRRKGIEVENPVRFEDISLEGIEG